jgi:hypothetical protein
VGANFIQDDKGYRLTDKTVLKPGAGLSVKRPCLPERPCKSDQARRGVRYPLVCINDACFNMKRESPVSGEKCLLRAHTPFTLHHYQCLLIQKKSFVILIQPLGN